MGSQEGGREVRKRTQSIEKLAAVGEEGKRESAGARETTEPQLMEAGESFSPGKTRLRLFPEAEGILCVFKLS